jgi:lipoate-protein ligase A
VISDGYDPRENLALEQYIIENCAPDEIWLYLWQNHNTVVIGRNQNPWRECDMQAMKDDGVVLVRRQSGGGAVFHDEGNLNFTFIADKNIYNLERQLGVVIKALEGFGLNAEFSGRNDILLDGKKFSGNAFSHKADVSMQHGTLLINSNMGKLSRYLKPSKAKLEAKGVQSVRSRVINLKELCPGLTCEVLGQYMEAAFQKVYGLPAEMLMLTAGDSKEIANSAETLRSWDWLYGQKLPFSVSFEERFSWGGILLELNVQNGCVESLQVYSDAMDWQLPEQVTKMLTGCRFTKADMRKALVTLTDAVIREDLCCLIEKQDI